MWVKDLALSLLCVEFDPWSRNFYIAWVGYRQKKKKKIKISKEGNSLAQKTGKSRSRGLVALEGDELPAAKKCASGVFGGRLGKTTLSIFST